MQRTLNRSEKQNDILKLFWVFGLLLFLAFGLVAHASAPTADSILLSAPNLYGKNFFTILINSPDPKEAPKNFRVLSSSDGTSLHASASAVLSKGQLEFLISKLNSDSVPGALGETKDIHIIDTSVHAHGFVNNMQVIWLDQNIKFGTEDMTFLDEEKSLLSALKKTKKLTLYTLPESPEETDFNLIDVLKRGGQKIQVQADDVSTEQQFLKSKKIKYSRIPVSAKDIPNLENKQIDQLARIIKKMKKNEWLHFHNEEGAGNLSQLILLADVLKNASNTKIEEILARQTGPNSQSKGAAITVTPKLEQIYAYAKEQSPEFKTSFAVWVQKQ